MRINRLMPVPMYILKSLDDGQELVGGFYSEELSPVSGPIFKRISRILGYRGRGRQRQALVCWLGFGPAHDSYVPVAWLTEVY